MRVPDVNSLAEGLTNPNREVHYCADGIAAEYTDFRGMIDRLCEVPIFQGARATRMRELLQPFDTHFAPALTKGIDRTSGPRMREHGLD
jgi:hypothetical protein